MKAWLRHRGLTAGAAILFAAIAVALAAPLLSPYDPVASDVAQALSAPSAAHWAGTDQLGTNRRVCHRAPTRLRIGGISHKYHRAGA